MVRRKGIPGYRLHKASGLGICTLDGHDHYFGPHDDPDSRKRYDRLIAQWLARDRQLPTKQTDSSVPTCISVAELIVRFKEHAADHYRRADGTQTGEVSTLEIALKPVSEKFGLLPVDDFGPNALRAIREDFIDRGMKRSSINAFIDKIRRCFKWGVSHELVTPNVAVALATVAGLRMGRSRAVESEPTVAANDADIAKRPPHLRPTLRALVVIQRASGARAGELLQLRPMDVDRTGETWWFAPPTHKTQRHGKRRRIAFGPKARAALEPLLAKTGLGHLRLATCLVANLNLAAERDR